MPLFMYNSKTTIKAKGNMIRRRSCNHCKQRKQLNDRHLGSRVQKSFRHSDGPLSLVNGAETSGATTHIEEAVLAVREIDWGIKKCT